MVDSPNSNSAYGSQRDATSPGADLATQSAGMIVSQHVIKKLARAKFAFSSQEDASQQD